MGKFKDYFNNLLAQDMAQQARQVQAITLVVSLLLLAVVWWLWQFKLDIAGAKMNIFELLLQKK